MGRLAVAVERILFRVVQESLVNIERHAASPTAVVSLAVANGDSCSKFGIRVVAFVTEGSAGTVCRGR